MFSMMIVAVMILGSPTEVSATTSKPSASIVVCASIDSDGEVVTMTPGIPVVTQDYQAMFTGAGLYTSDDLVYFADIGAEGAILKYANTSGGVDVYAFSGVDENLCFEIKVPMIGQKAYLLGMNRDAELISYEVEITDGSMRENKEGMYDLEIDFTDFNKFVAPAALVTDSGELLAIVVDDGGAQIYAFVEPLDLAGSGSVEGETEEDDSNEGSAAVPTRASREDDSEADSDDPEKKDAGSNENLLKIACVLLVLITIVILIYKKKKSNSKPRPVAPAPTPDEKFPVTKPITPEYPVTKPSAPEYPATKPVQKPKLDGWEDATTDDNGTGLFAVGVAGALQGREFPISDRGILIGRGENMDVRYPPDTKGVSRQHCKVFWKDGVLMLMDMGSTSGTLLRGKGQLPADVPVVVVEGDIFYLGSKENAMTIRLK